MDLLLCATVNSLLRNCRKSGLGKRCTPLFVQKLLYFYYVEELNLQDTSPVIVFEAWDKGPVVPDLYHTIKEYRWTPVTKDIPYIVDGIIYTLGDERIIRHAIKKYGRYTANELVNLSHHPKGAWRWTRDHNQIDDIIPNNRIKADIKLFS